MLKTVEIDHLFIFTAVGAPEGDRLVTFGLTEGAPNMHPGQGTANRRFFFRNAMLELLWVHDPAEAQSELTCPTHLWDHWAFRGGGACPFGFIFRPTTIPPGLPPFPTWDYRPLYSPEGRIISVATNAAEISEPLLFYLPFAPRADTPPAATRQPLDHAAGLRLVTRVELATPHTGRISPELKAVIDTGLVRWRWGEEYLLELGFDEETKGKRTDIRPELPLIICS